MDGSRRHLIVTQPNPSYPDSLGVHLSLNPSNFSAFRTVMSKRGLAVRGKTATEPWLSHRQDFDVFCYLRRPPGWSQAAVERVLQEVLNITSPLKNLPARKPRISLEEWRAAVAALEVRLKPAPVPTAKQNETTLRALNDSLDHDDLTAAEVVIEELRRMGVDPSTYAREQIRFYVGTGRFPEALECYEQAKKSFLSSPQTLIRVARAYLSVAKELQTWTGGEGSGAGDDGHLPDKSLLASARETLDLLRGCLNPAADLWESLEYETLSGELASLEADPAGLVLHAAGALALARGKSEAYGGQPSETELEERLRAALAAWTATGYPERDVVRKALAPLAGDAFCQALAAGLFEELEQPAEALAGEPGRTEEECLPSLEELRELARTGDASAVVSACERWLGAEASLDAEYYLIAGLAAAELGRGSAVAWLEAADRAGRGNERVWSALGDLLRSSQPERAVEYYEKASLENPALPDVMTLLLDTLMELNDPRKAAETCRRISATCSSLESARLAADAFEWRQYYLASLVDAGDASRSEEYGQATIELLDLMRREAPSDVTRALELFAQAQRLAKDDLPTLLAIAASLEAFEDHECRAQAVTLYVNLASAEVEKLPLEDHALLQTLARRIYLLNRDFYKMLEEDYERRRREATEHAELLGQAPADEELSVRGPDLSAERVVLVGGEAGVRSRAILHLQRLCRLKVTEIPPPWDGGATLHQTDVNRTLENATLVVEVTGCVKHSTTGMVTNALRQRPVPRVFARGTGQTSIVEAVLEYFGDRRASAA